MRVKFEGSTKDVQLTEVTAENYIVPKGEEGSYHVIQEAQQFDPRTAKRLSKPVLQKYDAKVWPNQKRALEAWGYTLTVVHDPSVYNERKEAERQNAAEERRRQFAEAEKQRKAEEREALKAELMAELRAEMEADDENPVKVKKTRKSNKQ